MNVTIQHIKKHKDYYHALLGIVIMVFWYFTLRNIGDLYMFPFLIMGVFTAKATERFQLFMKWGTDTMLGTFKTSVPTISLFVIELLRML